MVEIDQNLIIQLLDLVYLGKSKSPLTCFIDLKKKLQSKNRTVIYEYIGQGLGNYRYDIDLNTYIFDLNGDYISYGISIEIVCLKLYFGSQRFTIDLSKMLFAFIAYWFSN